MIKEFDSLHVHIIADKSFHSQHSRRYVRVLTIYLHCSSAHTKISLFINRLQSKILADGCFFGPREVEVPVLSFNTRFVVF